MGLAALVVGFIVLTAVWLAIDDRVPDFDSGKHFLYSARTHDALAAGDLAYPLDNWNAYPPLPHLVSAAMMLLAGIEWDLAVLAQNLVFVPALAVGCYLAGRAAYGSRAGLLAAVFALATPMVVSLFHLHMIDVQQAAMVALTVGLVLASDRFRRLPLAVLAGLACAGAMLTKQTSALFLAGFLLVVFLRGGWRRPVGIALFALPVLLLAVPWYLQHFDDLRGLTNGAAAGVPTGAPPAETAGNTRPDRWSTQNLGWYVWNAINLQFFLPLVLVFLAGALALSVRFLRRRRADDLTPELVLGGLVSFVAVTYLALKDPRYSIPAVVFMAALAAGGLTLLRGRARTVAMAAFAIVCVVNVAGTVTGLGDRVAIVLPGAPQIGGLYERHFTLYAPNGYIGGAPVEDGEVLAILEGARRDGVQAMEFDPGADALTFNRPGLDALAREAGIGVPARYDPAALRRGAEAFMLVRLPPQPELPEPCARLSDTRLIYVVRGSPFDGLPFYCPLPRR